MTGYVRSARFSPGTIAALIKRGSFGQSVRGFLRNYKGGKPWYDAAVKSAGNGAIMRIAPVVFPYSNSPSADLWVDTALLAAITHNDSAAIAASVAFVYLVWQLLGMTSPPDPWWNSRKAAFFDTDAVVTQYYLQAYLGQYSHNIEMFIDPNKYDKVLLLTPDVAWVADGLRFLHGEKLRWELHEKLKSMYIKYGFADKIIEISGDYAARLNVQPLWPDLIRPRNPLFVRYHFHD